MFDFPYTGGRSSAFVDLEKERMQAGLRTLIPHQISLSESSEAGSNKSDGGASLPSVSSSMNPSPVHKERTMSSKSDENNLISLLDGSQDTTSNDDDVMESVTTSNKSTIEKAASLDLNLTEQSSNTAVLSHSNSLDSNRTKKSVQDLLGDELSLGLNSDVVESVLQPKMMSKTESQIPSMKRSEGDGKHDENETLISLGDDPSEKLVSVESNSKCDSNLDLEVENKDDEKETNAPSEGDQEEEEDNLTKITAVIDEANEQKELDVYIVDIEDEDDYEDFEEELEEDMERFVTEEETPFLTSEGEATPGGAMEDKDVEHLQGFFEGVADRIASKNLEKSMGATPGGGTMEKTGTEGGGTMESPLIPKDTPQRPLTVSGDDDESLPQCV